MLLGRDGHMITPPSPRFLGAASDCAVGTTREARRGGRMRGASRESLFSCRAAAWLRRMTEGGDFAPRAPSDPTGRSNCAEAPPSAFSARRPVDGADASFFNRGWYDGSLYLRSAL